MEAVRDGLLLAFYASSTYEALLGELAASNCARPSPAHATSSPWSAGSLQRIIRSVTPPAGISLHRGATLKSTARSVWPSFVTIDFDSVEAPAGEQPSLRVLRALHRSSAAATDSLLALNPASLLSHIVPTLMDARVQSGAKLISSRVAPKLGPTLYCAALVSYEHLPVSHDLGTSPDFSPAASTVESMTPPVEAVTPSTESPTGKEKTDRVPSLPSSWMGSVLSRAFDTTQYSARNPAHSSVSDYESLPLSRFSLLGLPSALPLSPFLRAVGIRPAAAPGTLAAADERDAAASSSPFAGPAWAVHSPLAPRLRQQQLPGWEGPTGKHSIRLSGVVVVTEVPCVVALRESLTEINVQRSRSAWWESDGCGNKLLRALERCQHPDSAKDTASDFSAQALFEVLGPSALAAVFVAFLVGLV